MTDDDIVSINRTYCQKQDHYEVLASKNHLLQQKLNQLVKTFPTTINDKQLNYGIYLNTAPTAWSSLNGCIRINRGLMNKLNDNEIQAVIAHEIGHIALDHSIIAFRTAKSAEIDSSTGLITLINQQTFIQQQEFEADSYALNFLMENNINTNVLITALNKLDSIEKKENSSHPENSTRKMVILNQIH